MTREDSADEKLEIGENRIKERKSLQEENKEGITGIIMEQGLKEKSSNLIV